LFSHKPFRHTKMISTDNATISDEVPSIDPEASFSFSDDDEEIPMDRREMNTNPNTSFRLKIRKGIPEKESLDQKRSNELIDDDFATIRTNNSFPVTQKEKNQGQMKNSDNDAHGRQVSKFHRGGYYDQKSWRARNVSGHSKALKSSNDANYYEPNEPSYFESLLSMCNFFLSTPADDREIKPSTSSFEGVRESSEEEQKIEIKLSEKELRHRYHSCMNVIKSRKWDIVINEIETVPSLITFQDSKHENKNLIHVISGINSSIPSKLLSQLVKDKDALQQVDKNGCIPLHYAVSIGRSEELVRALLAEWKEGSVIVNKDGDSPLHVAVWNGLG
jgi:hypothetical protein